MSSDPAPGGWISDSHFYDIDAQAAQYQGYDQQYQQMGAGPFKGRLRSYDLGGDLVINYEMANREIAATAATPRGRIGACLLADLTSPDCTLNASEFSYDHVVLSPEAASIEGRMSAGVSMFCMDISATLLPDFEGRKAIGVQENPAATRRLRELVRSGLDHFGTLPRVDEYPVALVGFKSAVADLLWQMVTPSEGEGGFQRTHATTRSLVVFKRARDFIEHHLADGISITTLCRNTGVSRRSLESVFRAVVGMGPSSYMRKLQLNQVRRDLLATSEEDASVGSIAARQGIWHLSRFSSYYRELFGELPSETRRARSA